jgi:hypothetical protein
MERSIMRIIKNQKGETITEVLISVAVLSLCLGGAYALAQRSTISNQRSQERGEALKITESIVEQIKAKQLSGADGESFCVNQAAKTKAPLSTPFPVACKHGLDGRYEPMVSVEGSTYKVSTDWERLGGGRENLTLFYRP